MNIIWKGCADYYLIVLLFLQNNNKNHHDRRYNNQDHKCTYRCIIAGTYRPSSIYRTGTILTDGLS